MKQLIWKLILPLTVISFVTVTKWWYVLPIDAPDTLYSGFPFPFVGEGWHTSMSLQIFVLELIADFLVYFIFWFVLIFGFNRFRAEIKPNKFFTIGLWTISGIIVLVAIYIASFKDNHFYIKRPYKIEVLETGFKFYWQQTKRPDYYKYRSERVEK